MPPSASVSALASNRPDAFDVIVCGAGLAGLSAASALASSGARVLLLERRPDAGGRAYSYLHPALNETIDSQHVLVGCCTNLLALCDRAGIAGNLRWYDELTFLEPNGNRSLMRPAALPAPAHQALSFLRAPMLSRSDKLAIARGLAHFIRGFPADDRESFAAWIQRTRQPPRAIAHFWEPVIWGALNDVFERCSTRYVGKVFHETFLRSPEAGCLGIPAQPLTQFFAPVLAHARAQGVVAEHKTGADSIARQGSSWTVRSGDLTFTANSLILALNFRDAQRLVAGMPGLPPALTHDSPFLSAPITTIHLWFDREVSDLDHAVLLDTRIQWMFHKSRIRRWPSARGSYLELVISASWPELQQGREAILASALAEARLFFPPYLLRPGCSNRASSRRPAPPSPSRPASTPHVPRRPPPSPASSSPGIGPRPVGPPLWKAPSAPACSPLAVFPATAPASSPRSFPPPVSCAGSLL